MPQRLTESPLETPMPSQAIGKKHCTHCGEEKDCVAAFDRDCNKEDGFKDVCKKCRAKLHKEGKIALDQTKAEALQKIEDEGVRVLESLGTGGSFAPHIEELLEAVMEPFGGVRGYAKHLYAEYLACPVGSQRRAKYHHMITELINRVSKMELAEKRLEMMEDNDVVNIMVKHLKSFQESTHLGDATIPTLNGSVVSVKEESNA